MAGITVNISEPNEKQKLFLQDKHKVLLFGGAKGGGKSWISRVSAFLFAMEYAGIRIAIIRKSYPELNENHIKPLLLWLPKEIYKYNDSKKEMTFLNGSQIMFRYCANEADAILKFQGIEYDIIYLDEATQHTEEVFKVLYSCLRGANDMPKRFFLTANPTGVGVQWVKKLFIDKIYDNGENPEDYGFIQSLPTDNKALLEAQPDYLQQLEALPKKLRDAWLHGDWNVLEGQYFEEFADNPDGYDDHRFTNVIKPFDIPSHWNIVRCLDWGYRKPFSINWLAFDEEGVAYLSLEWYGCTGEADEGVKMTPDEVFSKVHEIETNHRWLKGKHITGVADPAIWGTDTGESINDVAVKHQVYFNKGDNSRIAGWMQFHYRLRFDENGYAMFYIFNTCKEAIRTIPLMQYDEYKVEDLDTTMEDHICDSLRYGFMSRPISAPKIKEDDGWEDNPLNFALDVDKEMLTPVPQRTRIKIKEG